MKSARFGFFFIILLILALPLAASLRETPESLVRQGRRQMADGDYAAANESFERALALDPGNREVLSMLRVSLDASDQRLPGRPARPRPVPPVYESETVLDTSDAPASPRARSSYFYRVGVSAYRGEEYKKAVEAFDQVIAIDPGYRRAAFYRERAWEKIVDEDWVREREEDRWIDLAESREAAEAYGRGRYFMRDGRFREAAAEFAKALELEPGHQGAERYLREARRRIEDEVREADFALAHELMEEEAAIRAAAREREERDLRTAYLAARSLMEKEEYEAARDKFTDIRRRREGYRRTEYYLRELDTEIWERREARRVDVDDPIRAYTIGPEDVVRVVVRNHPEFSFETPIEEGGELIIPLTNEIVMAEGLTRDELAEEVRKFLTAYIEAPVVNVFITRYQSKRFYVLQPRGGGGEFVMDRANMTLWDCMWRAGIPQLGQSAMRRVQVIEPHPTHPTHRWVNVYAMLYQGKMEDNIRIEPGTIIYYPMLAIDKFSEVLQAITRPITDLSRMGSDYERWDDFRRDYLR